MTRPDCSAPPAKVEFSGPPGNPPAPTGPSCGGVRKQDSADRNSRAGEDSPDHRPSRLGGRPGALFLTLLVSIFVVETLVMLLLERLPRMPLPAEALLDALLLSLVVSPALYFFSLKPLQQSIRVRETAEIEKRKALEFDQIKGDFISTAAHELLTPLTSVKGYVELLHSDEQEFDRETQKEFLATVYEQTNVLERIVDDMLDLSRVEAGRPVRLQRKPADILPVIEHAVDSFRHLFPHRRIMTFLPESVPPLLIDPVRIGQVVSNLLSNAVKYSPEESPIEVTGQVSAGKVVFAVKDRGIGMTAEQTEHIFDKFYRVDTSDTTRGGLGLGMPIARTIVEGHDGTIRVESEPGRGTTVSFTLPLPQG